MSTLVLILLIAAAVGLQFLLDARNVARVARQQRWSGAKLTWAPSLRRWLTGSRWTRSYWLRYRDESGRLARRLCHVTTNLLDGPSGVVLEPIADEVRERSAPAPLRGRLYVLVASSLAGGFLGVALGIGGSFLLYPTSNIAPAYGVLYGGPLGIGAGVLLGVLRLRARAQR